MEGHVWSDPLVDHVNAQFPLAPLILDFDGTVLLGVYSQSGNP